MEYNIKLLILQHLTILKKHKKKKHKNSWILNPIWINPPNQISCSFSQSPCYSKICQLALELSSYQTNQHWWTRTHKSTQELLNSFIVFPKCMLILNIMPATCFKNIGRGATKDLEDCGMLKNLLTGIFHNRWIANRWLYLDWLWKVCPLKQKVQQFKNSVSQYQGFGDFTMYTPKYQERIQIIWGNINTVSCINASQDSTIQSASHKCGTCRNYSTFAAQAHFRWTEAVDKVENCPLFRRFPISNSFLKSCL